MSTTELTRRERKKVDTRRRIFEAAISLFREKGFEATTVDEITEKADVGRGTFFNYFPKKESVLAWLSEEKLLVAEQDLPAMLESPRPTREKLVELYAAAASVYDSEPELARYVLGEWLRRAFQPTADVEKRWQKLVLDLLQQGRSQGEIREDVEPLRAESTLTAVYFSTVFQYLFANDQCATPIANLREELVQRFDIVLDGLVPATARKEVRE
ncbi:MAG: TetR/AcrR family transcriptional regulator [Candidatus Eisenbacteria bacterium]|nr:TetR/AcrR family transcriptional regulator [Candidatus Eisenbacteria bacterium]